MKNVIFISPNFPTNYWHFCHELKANGMNVLGIGDQPYHELTEELKGSLTEYYKVSSLENEDEVYRAVAFFAFKYGRIHWLESNNEYWLERDARLRTDFNIKSGFQVKDIPRIKFKSKMKEYYAKAGIPTAQYHMVGDLKGCLDFAARVGYPVVAKPDNGVGASDTWKIENDDQMKNFHFEFFRLTRDQKGLGKKGDVVALEVNMRPCGGFTPDMINFAHSTNVYKIWADMIAFDHSTMPVGDHAFCAFAGRRDGKNFIYGHDDIMRKYGGNMKMVERLPDVLSGAMGNQMYMAVFPTEEELDQFYEDVLEVEEDRKNEKEEGDMAE